MPCSCYGIGLQSCIKRIIVTSLTHLFAGVATAAIQQGNSTGTGDWITITSGSQEINGVQTTWIKDVEIMYGARYRLRIVGTGMQTTKINAYAVFKK